MHKLAMFIKLSDVRWGPICTLNTLYEDENVEASNKRGEQLISLFKQVKGLDKLKKIKKNVQIDSFAWIYALLVF